MVDIYNLLYLSCVAGVIAVVVLFLQIFRTKVNDKKAEKIAKAISDGAMTFLKEEYTIIALVVAVIASIICYVIAFKFAVWFVIGAVTSLLAGFIGMKAATSANVRTTILAKEQGEYGAFMSAFLGGGVMGFSVATIGLIGITIIMKLYGASIDFILYLTCFNLGASLVSFFARIGGGIFTKSADVGADLVGKLEIGIPEDDPRNPAVIADNVGDCVGDTAGMGADIYESYVGAIVSSMVLAITLYPGKPQYIILPIVFAAIGLLSSIGGMILGGIFKTDSASMLRNATYFSIAFFVVGAYWFISQEVLALHLFYATLIGCFSGVAIGLISEYYTGGTPIKRLAESCQSGAATNIIYGLSIGMESVGLPVVLLGFAVLLAYNCGGQDLYAVAIAAVAMLSTTGIIMTVDAYGPIADNAGGIAEMAGFGKEVRAITDKLDAIGNTTAAIGKGFAIGSALMTALTMFAAYAEKANLSNNLNILDPVVLTGMFIGSVIPFIISSMTMRSVGKAALQIVMEVRHQFKTIPGLMEGTADPDYARCIAISTRASLYEMMLPGIITVIMPVVIFYGLGKQALGGFLVGATLTGVTLALMMANGGGAWDNAKKYIEAGNMGGKGSDAHRAAVVGDTVGDPFKDTSGPALNILIKLMSVISLLLASL